jgi:hypothetical protein
MANLSIRHVNPANSGNPVRNYGGSILFGRSSSNSNVTQAITNNVAATGLSLIVGPRRVETIAPSSAITGGHERMVCVARADNAGTFGKLNPGKYVVMGLPLFLGGIAAPVNNGIQGMGTSSRPQSLYPQTSIWAQQMRKAGWNYVTGQFLTPASSIRETFPSTTGTPSGVDTSAYETRSAQAPYRMFTGAKNPVKFTPLPKTGG